ncbi:ATP-binding cassette subfamily C protein/ATP-binding cassette subfamily C protein EexD [Roseibium hamelinense]|uniref:ATP-binding cassette subfamily C protein/ATP-binding cassette subfamily C protein EexD n=1 Tax=Roseibium hamelinense TaxID=150831 RepID=A0A562T3H8_9HYPH|nr:type I secretion system permease/ATPase [Roseibium hamelinense]MTI44453.1 type I secretion system permease/ATPase [Roseibium hamelinense]TWI87420.1 ATP-binding cassette subfamily C protein/ATP-binding cassette subfamily C protein EexD [Roseibium hamelinense]
MGPQTPLRIALKKFRSILGTTVVFSFFINLLMFIGPLYMLQVYDRVLASRNETTLLMLTVIACALLAIYGILEFVRSRLLVRAGIQFDEVLAQPLFHRVLKGTLQTPGSNTAFALGDIDKLREFLTGNGLLAILDAPWVPIFLAVCFVFHPLLGFVATTGAVLIFILALANEFSTSKTLREAGMASQTASHFASTTLQNAEVIKALGMESALREKWQDKHRDVLSLQAKASDRAGVVMSMSKFVRMALQVFILGAGAYLVLQNEVSPGIMIAASIMMGRALAPVEQAVAHWKQVVAARSAYSRLDSLFDKVKADPERTDLPAPTGDVNVEGLVSVIPGTRNTVLNGVTFALAPGEVLAVIGPSGAGKSSLVRHLVGVWSAINGTVRLDGAELVHWDPERLAQYIGYLPQDVELFSGTISENIARFQLDRDEDVVAAAKKAGVHEMILELSDGYDTQIGEGGRQLSGGQRQRVGLARAMFGDPKMIVLDEPNSNLDSSGEEALMGAIQSMKESGSTVIFVSHKANLLALSEKVLVLNKGRVQAFGPTQQIMQPSAKSAQIDGNTHSQKQTALASNTTGALQGSNG